MPARSTRMVAAAAAAVATAGLVGFAVGSPSAGAATAWSPTSSKALTLVNATKLGATPSSRALHLTVGLAQTAAQRSAVNALIKAQATKGNASYGKFLTPAQYTAKFAPSADTATAVSKYLQSQGMQNVAVSSNRLQVTADATAGQAETAFDTSMSAYTQAGKYVRVNTEAASVPSTLAGKVTSVLGLSSLGASLPLPPVVTPKLTGFYPKEFDTVYDTWDTSTGGNSSVAVFAEGDLTQTVKDLRTAEANQGLRQVPVSLQYSGIKSPDTSGADEWDLDSQTSTGVASGAKSLYFYISTSLTDADLARSFNLWVAQDKAQAGSASLGECDILPATDGAAVTDDMIFAEAAVQGQTFFASSGDTGSSCAVAPSNGVPGSGPPDTEYPASSTYATAVGGTTLLASTTNVYSSEVSWNSGGGGISPVEYPGYWQSGVVPTSAGGLRGSPDVAFDADPNTGALIVVDGAFEQIGGTSLSSPLAMGLWTRLNSSYSNQLGFAPPKLYALYSKAQTTPPVPPTAVPGFHDITVGSNGAYTALPGYDFTTGLGSWDIKLLYYALK